jgi:phage gpG-like protein
MSDEIKIELTPEAQQVLASMKTLPERLPRAVAAALDLENVLTVSHIKEAYLAFPRSGPTTPIGLRKLSGRLHQSARASKAVVSGSRVESSIGDNVKYAAIHEFGGTIQHPARAGKVRLATDRQGRLVRQSEHPHLAVFARRSRGKLVKEVGYRAKAYDVEMPARGMFQRGIKDRLTDYGRSISAAVIEGLRA